MVARRDSRVREISAVPGGPLKPNRGEDQRANVPIRRSLAVIAVIVALFVAACGGQRTVTGQQPTGPTAGPEPARWTFDQDAVGGPPQGATVFSGTWAVCAETDAPSPPNVLCQTGTATFPAIQLSDTLYSDVVLSARFKPVSGRTDQAAGLIFRIQDKDNYYIVRGNALENNVNIYKYVNGQRLTIKEGNASVLSGQWQELRAEAVSHGIRAYLNGELVVEAADATYAAGTVGLWTKADSVTCFDDVEAQGL